MREIRNLDVLTDRLRYEGNLLEVLDETALEDRHGTYDVRGEPACSTFMIGSIVEGQGRIEGIVQRLRPLLTGAAWKILDQTIEHQMGHRPGTPNLSITSKVRSAASYSVASPLANDLRTLWHGVLDAYKEYSEVRHGLIHRIGSTGAAGSFNTTLDDGVTPVSVSVVEQQALCRLARRLVDYTTRGNIGYDYYADMGHQLSLLTRVQNRAWPARNRTMRTEYIDSFDSSSEYIINIDHIKGRVIGSLYTTTCIDLVIEVDRSRNSFLAGPLELARDLETISSSNPPSWLVEQVRPRQARPRGLDG